MAERDVRQIGRYSSFSLLFALRLKRRDVKLQLYSTIDGGTQGVGVKSIRLSNLCVQSLNDSVTECDAKFVTQLGEYTAFNASSEKLRAKFLMRYDGFANMNFVWRICTRLVKVEGSLVRREKI